MAISNRGQATKGGDKRNRRDREPGIYLDPGPYIAIVTNNVDVRRMGFVTVHIPDLSSSDSETFDVRFASPFVSHTYSDTRGGDYNSVKQSAGMWMQSPDIGTEVVVMFPSGNVNKGIWFACLHDRYNNHSFPGNASSEFWDAETDTIGQFANPVTGKYGKYQAVGEFYDPIKKGKQSYHENVINPLTKKRPINPYLNQTYVRQGLQDDIIRGHTSSSAQREAPSNVFGISTKGRFPDNRDMKNRPDVVEKLRKGNISEIEGGDFSAFKPETRKHGHSFVLDDGDLEGNNELIRLRSSSGHQILLHDTEGVVYIANATGSVWMEFGNDGTMDVYAQKGFNVRSREMNFYADTNINMHAAGNISMLAGGKFQADAGNIDLRTTKGGIGIDSKNVVNVKSSGAINLDASGNANIKAGSEVKIDGNCVELGNGADGVSSSPSPISASSKQDTVSIGNGFWGQKENSAITTIVSRMPTHEPFVERSTTQESVTAQDRLAAQAELAASVLLGDIPPAEQSGPVQAKSSGGVSKNDKVSRASIIKQPEPNDVVGDLTPEQTKQLLAAIGQRESSGNYLAVNQFGYLGKYQMGMAALEDAGYIKPGTFAAAQAAGYGSSNINTVMNDPNVWTGKGGIGGRTEFLASPAIQEEAMEIYTDRNVNTLRRIGVINSQTPVDQQAGLIMAAHLKGPGDVKKWYVGGGTYADGNGVTIDQYYNIGRSAVA